MRQIPLHAARQLGRATRVWKGFPFIYIGVMFFLVPLIFLGISYLFTVDTKGGTIMGSLIVVVLFLFLCWLAYYCQYKGGKERCYNAMVTRQKRRDAFDSLPEDMEYLKAKVKYLIEHTGLPDDEEMEAQTEELSPGRDKNKDDEPASNDDQDAA
jgi:sodium-dependent phosphate cotransporter